MADSNGGKENLRIRFAGLCLFVPDPDRGQVHVLMPHVHDHQAQQTDRPGSAGLPEHLLCLYWVQGGAPRSTSLSRDLVLHHPKWEAADTTIPGVFDMVNAPKVSGCSDDEHGTVNLDHAHPAVSLVLQSGRGKVVSRGAAWTFNKGRHVMPTAMDWWVRGVDYGDVLRTLESWGVVPDLDRKGNVNLWIIHATEKNQKPGEIGKPESGSDDDDDEPHFHAYYSLLHCQGYDEKPTDPQSQSHSADDDPPEWPDKGKMFGSFRNCMLAQAAMTGTE